MVSRKVVSFNIHKPENYIPIRKSERKRITKLVMKEVFNIAGRFDGASKMRIALIAKGNM